MRAFKINPKKMTIRLFGNRAEIKLNTKIEIMSINHFP